MEWVARDIGKAAGGERCALGEEELCADDVGYGKAFRYCVLDL